MGAQGTGKGLPGDLVFDAGALIAFERGDRDVALILKSALAFGSRVIVPAGALAQVWRGGSRSAPLARVVDAAEVEPLGEARAKEVGERLGLRGGTDVTDAHVVCCALEYRAAVATSDSDDIRALAEPGETVTLIEV